jgi:anti-sigma-K factor RskA
MSEERDLDAAEYVLGTLPADERARFSERLKSDAALRQDVRAWEARLAPLDETATPVAPPPDVWRAIDRATSRSSEAGSEATGSNVIALRRRVAFWRGSTAVAGLLAAGLAVVAVVDRLSLPPVAAGGRYVAVVDSGGHEPALIAEVDTTTGTIRVRSLTAETPSGRSLELWHVPEGQAPRSLGILKAGLDAQTINDAASAGPVDGLIAVSVEPEGGSPSGAPTGPIVYTGRLIPVE